MNTLLRAIGSAALAFALLAAPARAETSPAAYDAVREALIAVWAELPLTVRNVTLTEGHRDSFGNYTATKSNAVKAGAPVHIYLEVLGYGWATNADGTVSELLDADLDLVNAEGQTVAGQQKFLSTEIRSRTRLMETYLTLEAMLSAFQPGSYRLRFTLHDRAGKKETRFEVPVSLQ